MVQLERSHFSSLGPRLLGNLKATLTTLGLGSTLLFTNACQMASLIIRPFSSKRFRNFNTFCAGSWWGLGRWWTEGLYGIRAVFRGDEIPAEENAIIICNHQCMTDIVALWSLAWRKGRLGDMKFAVKQALKYVPGIGWGMWFLDCLFLKRNWENDERMIRATFAKYARFQIPLWLISFSEGTRLTRKKWEAARQFAQKRGLPAPENVLVPRTKGFVAAVSGLRDYATAVYDITIAYPQGIPSVWQLIQGRVDLFVVHVRRFPIESLPHDKAELASWLMGRFEEKDKLIPELLSEFPPPPPNKF